MSVRKPHPSSDPSNFGFLAKPEPLFFQLGCSAERLYAFDPNVSLIKLRQLGEAMARSIAARVSRYRSSAQIRLYFLRRIQS